jgi:branched-chain amino acid transport system substrate-binding protein
MFLTVAISVMMAVSACGQAPASQNPGTSDQPTQQQSGETSAEPIKIGAILPYSGVYTSLGENLTKGMELYFDSVNWEVEGRKIELIKEDEENDPQAALRKLRKLMEKDQIDILTGPVSTAVAYALRDEVDKNKLPFLVSHAGGNDLTRSKRSDYIWRSSFSSWQIGHSMGQYAYDHVAKEVYVTAADYAFGQEVAAAFKEAFTAAGGTIVGEVYPPLGSNDYASFLTQIQSVNPPAVYAFFAGSDSVRFVQQYEQYGLKGKIPLIGSGWLNAEDIRPAQGTAGDGIISTMFWDYHLDTPENKAFVEAYEAKYAQRPSIESLEGYDAARVIVEALKLVKGDTSDKDSLAKALGSVRFTSPRGEISFDPSTHHVIQNMYVVQTEVADGKTENKVLETIGVVKDPGQ